MSKPTWMYRYRYISLMLHPPCPTHRAFLSYRRSPLNGCSFFLVALCATNRSTHRHIRRKLDSRHSFAHCARSCRNNQLCLHFTCRRPAVPLTSTSPATPAHRWLACERNVPVLPVRIPATHGKGRCDNLTRSNYCFAFINKLKTSTSNCSG